MILFYIWSFVALLACNCNAIQANLNGGSLNETLGVDALSLELLRLNRIPKELLSTYPFVTKLYMGGNRIKYITKDDFPTAAVQHIKYIGLHGNAIDGINPDAFTNMPNLIFLDLSGNKLKSFPIIKAPNLTKILLSKNQIRRISPDATRYYKSIEHIELRHNQIEEISSGTFAENKKLIFLDLENNPLKKIDNKGLLGPKSLKYLYLKNTHITEFPSYGISQLETLEIRNIPDLFHLPKASNFKNLKDIFVTYRMLCCPFRRRLKEYKSSSGKIIQCNRTVETKSSSPTTSPTTTAATTITTTNSLEKTIKEDDGGFDKEEMEWIMEMYHGTDESSDPCDPSYWSNLDWKKILSNLPEFHVNCQPEPDAFNPCEDVMGTDVLRGFSWIISIFAVIGNLFQLVVLFHSKQKCVYKLLMYNLGFSNLLMGVYLLILCCVDAYTYGEYYDFVYTWQYNGGCQGLGFLAVFSTSLSVCSLVLITLERFLLIVYALESSYQMHIKHAKFGIAVTWVYSFIVAVLPVTNVVSSYSKTAICLPMDIYTSVSEGYVIWLLIAYLLAFVMVVYCYLQMYKLVKHVRPVIGNSTVDTQVAKRIALIIFSNFLCWLPISFTGLLAMYSGIIFNVNVAKFLIVFIFPLNACTNPFLYTIFTKIFREDTLDLLYKLSTRSRTSSERSDHRERSSSYFKGVFQGNGKGRAGSTPLHLHVQPPSNQGSLYLNEGNIETEETDFDSPGTPLKSVDNLQEICQTDQLNLQDRSSSQQNIYEEIDNKERSNSTRGLLEEYRKQEQIGDYTPYCESTMSSSVGTPNDANLATDENFTTMIGSMNEAKSSILDTK